MLKGLIWIMLGLWDTLLSHYFENTHKINIVFYCLSNVFPTKGNCFREKKKRIIESVILCIVFTLKVKRKKFVFNVITT